MAKKVNSEDKLIEKIEKVNKEMAEINQEPIKKIAKKKSTSSTIKTKNETVKTEIVKKTPVEKAKKTIKKIEEKEEKPKFGLFEAIVILVNVALVFCLIGYLVGNKLDGSKEKDYTTVDKDLQLFIEQYNNILENYYGDIDKNELMKGAINGMLSSLDDYSGILNSSSNTDDITLEGKYEGIGVGVSNTIDGQLIVVSVYSNSPASQAGIEPGDVIINLNSQDIKDVTSNDFVNMVKEQKEFSLTVKRGEQELTFNLSRKMVVLKSVFYEMKDNKVGYIQVSIFANNTYEQFKLALEDLESQGMEKLIIDVRGNSGGHLTAVKDMLSLFMDKSHVIYQTEDKKGTEKTYSTGKINKEYKIVILQNSSSASASEVLASSLKENLDAYIIGKKSFGKGTVQQLNQLGNIEYKFTTKKWLTPKGNWINSIGIIPDKEIDLSEEYYKNPSFENDLQYQAAIEYLK